MPGIELSAVLGRGGMGIVYRGRQGYLDREVAVKFLDVRTARGEFEARFRREARLLAGLTHPNIVACYQAGTTEEGFCYLVMEFIDGPDLRGWIEENGRMEPETAVSVCHDVALALHHAQHTGIIHRDVKAANVFLGVDAELERGGEPFPFRVKLGDLGLARPTSNEVEGAAEVTQLTQGWVGSPATMAPEQFDDGRLVDHRADIYGLGCVLYQLLTGSVPYSGTHSAVIKKKMERFGPDPRAERPELPKPLGQLVQRMLAHDPAERPQTYEELLEVFDRFLSAPETARARRSRTNVWVGAAVAGVLGAAGLWAWWPKEGRAGGLEIAFPTAVRAGWPVELAVQDAGLDGWTWTWEQLAPASPALELATEGGVARFVAPEVDEPRTFDLRVRAIRDDGKLRQDELSVRVLPTLALGIRGPLEVEEAQGHTWTADPGSGETLGALTYRWTSDPPVAGIDRATDAALSLAPPDRREDYGLSLVVVALEGEREAGRAEQRIAVRADDDPPTLDGVQGEERKARPGQVVELGGTIADPDSSQVEASWSLAAEPQSELTPAARAALEAALADQPVALLRVAAPPAGSRAHLELTLDDHSSNKVVLPFVLEVPDVVVQAPEVVDEGEPIELRVIPPENFPPASELAFAWRLAGIEWPAGEGRLVAREGREPEAAGAPPEAPLLLPGTRWTQESFSVRSGGWNQSQLELVAPLADREYGLVLELTISGVGSRSLATEVVTGTTVRVQADDAQPKLFLVADSLTVDPLQEVVIEAVAFDPDSEVGTVPAALEWESHAPNGSPGPGPAPDDGTRARVRAPSAGELAVTAHLADVGQASLTLRVQGSLSLAVEGAGDTREGESVRLVAAVTGNTDEAIRGECQIRWRLDAPRDAALWEPADDPGGKPRPWALRDELVAEVEGRTLEFVAPRASQPYDLELTVSGLHGGSPFATQTVKVPVAAEDDPALFDLAGLPGQFRADAVPAAEWCARVSDADTVIASYQWRGAAADGEARALGERAPLPPDGRIPWPAGLEPSPGSGTLALSVFDSAGAEQTSAPHTFRVLPRPAIEVAKSDAGAREGATFHLRASTVGLVDGTITWSLEGVRVQGERHFADPTGAGEAKKYTEALRSKIAGWLGAEPAEGVRGAEADWTLTAPLADGDYELVFAVAAQEGPDVVLEEVLVRVEAQDAAPVLRTPPAIVTGPREGISLFAELVDSDTPTVGKKVAWRVEGGPASVSDTQPGPATLDASKVKVRTRLGVVATFPGAVEARTEVLVDPGLRDFPGSACKLIVEPPVGELQTGDVEGWLPHLALLGDKPDLIQSAVGLRHRDQDDWTYCSFRGAADQAALIEHGLPSASDFRLAIDLGVSFVGTQKPLQGLGVCVREASGRGKRGRAVLLHLREVDGKLEEQLATLELETVTEASDAELGTEPRVVLAHDRKVVKSFPSLALAERFSEANLPGQDKDSKGTGHFRLEIVRRNTTLSFAWGDRQAAWELPAGFAPGAVGVWVERDRVAYVRNVTLEPLR